jgi:hypothetical protein
MFKPILTTEMLRNGKGKYQFTAKTQGMDDLTAFPLRPSRPLRLKLLGSRLSAGG